MAKAGKGIIQKPTGNPVVGYGAKGHAFHSVEKFNKSKSGQAKTPSAKNKALAGLRREISVTNAHPMPLHNAAPPQQAHAPAGFTTPMPGHPSGNASHVHGPSTTGRINGPAPRGGGMFGMK